MVALPLVQRSWDMREHHGTAEKICLHIHIWQRYEPAALLWKKHRVHEAVSQDYFLIHHPCKMFDRKIPSRALSSKKARVRMRKKTKNMAKKTKNPRKNA